MRFQHPRSARLRLLGVSIVFLCSWQTLFADTLEDALRQYRTGDCLAAIKLLQPAVAANPDANLPLGRCYVETGLYKEAIDPLLASLRQTPSDTRALHLLVMAYTSLKLHDEAGNLVHSYLVQHPGSLAAQVESGRLLLADGDKQSAAAVFQSVLEKSPEFPAALLGMGLIATAGQQWTEAIRLLTRANQIAPGSAAIYAAIGDVYMRQGKCEEATGPYKQAFDLVPSNFATAKSLAKCYSQLGKQEEVARVLQSGTLPEAKDTEATNLVAASLKSNPKALDEYLRNVIELNPENVVARRLRAETLETTHNLDQARAEYVAIIKLEKDHPDPSTCYKLGVIEESTKDFENARKHYEIAANSPAATVPMNLALARVDLLLKDTSAAQVQMNKLEESVRQTPEFRLLQLQIYVASNQFDSAAALAGECLAQHPDDTSVLSLAAAAAHNQQRFSDEADLVERLYKLTPDDKDLRVRLVRLYVGHPELKKDDRVLDLLSTFVSHQEVDPEGYFLLAFFYQGNKDSANARTYFDLGFSKMPTPVPARFSWVYTSYAQFLFAQHDLEGALTSQQRALQLNPVDENGQYNLGVIYVQLGRIDDAQQVLSKLQALNSDLAADLDGKIRSASHRQKSGAQ